MAVAAKEALVVRERESVALGVVVPLRLGLALGLRVLLAAPLRVRLALGLRVLLAPPLKVRLALPLRVPLPLREGEALSLPLLLTERVRVGVRVPEALREGERDCVPVTHCEGERLPLALALSLRLTGLALALALPHCVAVALTECVGDWLREALVQKDTLRLTLPLALRQLLAVRDTPEGKAEPLVVTLTLRLGEPL